MRPARSAEVRRWDRAILDLLEADAPLTTKEIRERLPDIPYQRVYERLRRMQSNGVASRATAPDTASVLWWPL